MGAFIPDSPSHILSSSRGWHNDRVGHGGRGGHVGPIQERGSGGGRAALVKSWFYLGFKN